MTSLSHLWESINDFVALLGSKGCPLSKAFDAVGLHNDALRRRFTQKLRDQGKHEITEIKMSEKSTTAEKQANVLSTYGSSLLCKAKSSADFWKAIGIETFMSIPDSQVLTSLLELLGMARGHGILTTEACQKLGVSQLYTVVERGVALGVIVKRTVIPGPTGISVPASQRVKSRTVILHLRRFAAEYNPIADRASFEADDQMKEDVCRYIKKFMRTFSRTSVFFTDIDNAIGCCPRTLRNAFADELQKRDTGIRLYGLTIREDSGGTSLYSDNHRGRISFALVDDDLIMPSPTALSASGQQQEMDECCPEVVANSALYEQASARIRWNGSKGVLSHHIRSIHCLFPKRNDRLINDLRTTYNYSVNKQQCGKQAAYRIYPPPGDRDASNASDDNNESKPEPNDKKKADAGVMTELKSERLRFILDLLQKEGGVRSFQQIAFSLRQYEAVRGVGFTAARRTVAKCLQQLQIDGKITQVSVPLPSSVDKQSSENDAQSRKPEGPELFKRGDTVQLVLLNEAGTAEALVAAFLQRQSDEVGQRLQNLAEKTKVKAKSSQPATTPSSKKKKPKKRVVQDSSDSSVDASSEGDDFFEPAAVTEADDSDSGSDQLFDVVAAAATSTRGAARGSERARAATVSSGAAKRKSRARSKPPAAAPVQTFRAASGQSGADGRILPSSLSPSDDGGILPSAPLGTDEPLAASNESRRSTYPGTTGSFQKRKLPVELAFAQLLDSFDAARTSGADSSIRLDDEDAEEMSGENRSISFDSSSNNSSARKRKGADVPLDEQQLPKKIGRNSTVTASSFVGSASTLSSAPPLGLMVPEALAHARSTDSEPTKDDAVTPQESFLLCHMFSLDETFDCVQSTTVLCDVVTSVDGEGSLPTDDYDEKPSRLPEEDAVKDTNTTRQTVRCVVRFPVVDVISAAAAEAINKAMGPCHSGHYGPNLNRVLCGMNATTPADTETSSRYKNNHNDPAEDDAKWLLTQVLEAGMSGVTLMELAQRQKESSSNQSLVDVAQDLVRDGLISIVHTPIDHSNQQAHDQMTTTTINTTTTRFIDPVYASLSYKIANVGGEEDDLPSSSSSWSGRGSSRGRTAEKTLQQNFRCKVVLLLTQKPGCYLEQIHATACPQLTLDQVITLLGDMENDGLLFSRKCSMSVCIASPFHCIDNANSTQKTVRTGNVAFFLRF